MPRTIEIEIQIDGDGVYESQTFHVQAQRRTSDNREDSKNTVDVEMQPMENVEL